MRHCEIEWGRISEPAVDFQGGTASVPSHFLRRSFVIAGQANPIQTDLSKHEWVSHGGHGGHGYSLRIKSKSLT
jgi:hypothetical protein